MHELLAAIKQMGADRGAELDHKMLRWRRLMAAEDAVMHLLHPLRRRCAQFLLGQFLLGRISQ